MKELTKEQARKLAEAFNGMCDTEQKEPTAKTFVQKFNRWHDPKTGRFTFAPDKGYAAGGGGGMSDSNGRGLSSAQAAYFADSKAVDADGNLAVVYHGTVNEFTEFDESYFDPRSDMGAGIYLSNSHSDSESNYGDEQGPDLRNKISAMADRLEAEGMDYDEAYAEAEKMFITSEPQTLECYVNMQNPVYITRAPGKNTKFTFDEGYDPELDEYGDPDGTLIELTDRIADAVYSGKYSCWDHDGFVEEVRNKLYQEAMDWGEVDAETVVKVIKDASWNYEITAENRFGDGLMAGSEVARDAFERMGYDGIIDSTVSGKFRGMNNMDNSTTHYIAFNSSQVKLVSNQNPTDSADITKAVIELDIVEGM